MKKLLISLAFIFIVFQTGILAYDSDFSVYSENNVITKIETSLDIDDALMVIYNNDNTVSSVHSINFKSHTLNNIIQIPKDDYFLKIYYDIGSDKSSLIRSDEVIKVTQNEDIQKPETYPSGAASIGAIAVIKSAEDVVVEDDEIVTRIVCLYKGEEITVDLENDFKITATTPQTAIYDGMKVSTLSEGDLVSFSAYLNGNISDVNLLFKPYKTDIITQQNNNIVFPVHSNKFNTFGVIFERLKNNTVVLYDNTKLESNALYLSLHENAPVYVYDMSKRKDKLSIGTVSDIIKSEILPSELDDDKNIISWGAENVRNYAYVRVFNNLVCDIVVYANYNS